MSIPNKDPLHGITLENIMVWLVENYGWEYLASQVKINCFHFDPSIKSSLTFLRKTPWARAKVESLYLYLKRKEGRG
ncbi:MAG: DUF2132 domain-containing protein [Chitinophagaceae bacterium]|nr:DUF2132 domain-containing protein [Chitinophagaceae bacterium]